MISIVKLSQIDRRPQLNIETSKSVRYSKGGNNKPRNFSNSSHNTGGEDKVSEKGQTFENMLLSTSISHGRGSTSSASIQNSKYSKASNKSDQV